MGSEVESQVSVTERNILNKRQYYYSWVGVVRRNHVM